MQAARRKRKKTSSNETHMNSKHFVGKSQSRNKNEWKKEEKCDCKTSIHIMLKIIILSNFICMPYVGMSIEFNTRFSLKFHLLCCATQLLLFLCTKRMMAL